MKFLILTATTLSAIVALAPAQAQRAPQGPQTRDAYVAAQKERFARMDANHDGFVTKDELSAQMAERMDGTSPPQEMVDRIFDQIDTDGDGKASAAEAEAAAVARFTTLDADHDGILTVEERRAGRIGMMTGRP